jgi:hypothetical protein
MEVKMIRKTIGAIRWILTIILVGFALVVIIFRYSEHEIVPEEGKINDGTPTFIIPKQKIDAEAVAKQFLQGHSEEIQFYENEDRKSIALTVSEIERYFALKYMEVSPLVDDLFSIKSKLKIGYYYIRGKGRLDRYLQEKIEHYLGDPEELRNEINTITSTLKMGLEKNHNELMLALEADLAVLPYDLKMSNQSSSTFVNDFKVAFDNTIKGMLPRTAGVQLGVEAIGLAIDMWVAPVIGSAVVNFLASRSIIGAGQLAAQGTAIGAGASLGPYTLGSTLVVGTIIALIIDWGCNRVAKSDAEKQIMASIDEWRDGTVNNFKETVSAGLQEFHNTRKKVLKSALIQGIADLAKANNLYIEG